MDKIKTKIFTDCLFEIAKKYDTCGDPKCDLAHAVFGVMLDKKMLHEAIKLAKQRGIDEKTN